MSVAVELAPVTTRFDTIDASDVLAEELEQYRRELTGYCYRMLGSGFEAEDAVQETMVRAWKGIDGFEGRSAVRSWLYRIATNVCLDMLRGRQRRARPMDLGPGRRPPSRFRGATLPRERLGAAHPRRPGRCPTTATRPRWRRRGRRSASPSSPRCSTCPARQRAVLILREVLRWQATRGGRAARHHAWRRSTAPCSGPGPRWPTTTASADRRGRRSTPAQQALLARYVDAFERYDIDLAGRRCCTTTPSCRCRRTTSGCRAPDEMGQLVRRPGHGCEGSRLVAADGQRLRRLRLLPPGRPGRPHAVVHPGDRDLRRPDRRPPQLPRPRPVPAFGLPERP